MNLRVYTVTPLAAFLAYCSMLINFGVFIGGLGSIIFKVDVAVTEIFWHIVDSTNTNMKISTSFLKHHSYLL